MFPSRQAVGSLLAKKLKAYQNLSQVLVLGIPRGGVVVAERIAHSLKVPLDVVVVKKLSAPQNPELAIGAITYDQVAYLDRGLITTLDVSEAYLQQEIKTKQQELWAREKLLRGKRSKLDVSGKTVIVVDDGVATGATLKAAILWLRQRKAQKIVLAIGVISSQTKKELDAMVEKIVALKEPEWFSAVGQFYQDFSQVEEREVQRLLK